MPGTERRNPQPQSFRQTRAVCYTKIDKRSNGTRRNSRKIILLGFNNLTPGNSLSGCWHRNVSQNNLFVSFALSPWGVRENNLYRIVDPNYLTYNLFQSRSYDLCGVGRFQNYQVFLYMWYKTNIDNQNEQVQISGRSLCNRFLTTALLLQSN